MSEHYKDIYKVDNVIETEDDERLYYYNRLQILLGELKPTTKIVDVVENDKLIKKEIKLSVAYIKAIEEIINNSIDIFIKTDGKYANKLKVDISGNKILVSDSGTGTGIPLDKVTAAFTNFRTSSNFEWKKEDDFERVSGSQNGIGAKATNVGSKSFQVTNVTLDGKRSILVCKDNMTSIVMKEDKAPPSSKPGVIVEFELDKDIFGVTEDIMPDIINHIHALLINVNVTYPQVDITFQGKLIKIKQFSDYTKYLSDHAVIVHDDSKISVAVYPSEDFNFIFSANSINLYQGGNILTYISSSIVSKLTERIQKSYKKINTSNVKNKLGFVVILRNVTNLAFGGGQNKSSLTNNMSDLSLPTINYAELAEKLYKYKPISEPIIELYRLQQELEKRKAMSNLKAEVKEKFNAKLLKATNKSKYLMVAEGDSAIGSLPEVFGRNEISYLPLGGKLINSLKSRPEIIKKNKRAEDLIEAFGIGLPENRSENIIIATDSDLDGAHIRTLILALFYVLEPDVLINNRMFVLNTPVMVITDKKDNVVDWYYTLREYQANQKNIKPNTTHTYMKGLGSWSSKNLKIVLDKDGLERMVEPVIFNDETDGITIKNWLTDEGISYRKTVLEHKSFNIDNI